MGYYSEYSLKVINGDYNTDYERIISDEAEQRVFFDSCKWYSYQEDMKTVSKLYPEVVFEITGNGEDDDDFWKAYFKDGKMQMCPGKIFYDPFDETKLK